MVVIRRFVFEGCLPYINITMYCRTKSVFRIRTCFANYHWVIDCLENEISSYNRPCRCVRRLSPARHQLTMNKTAGYRYQSLTAKYLGVVINNDERGVIFLRPHFILASNPGDHRCQPRPSFGTGGALPQDIGVGQRRHCCR